MHPGLRALADRLGIKISNRSAWKSNGWDGKTIALLGAKSPRSDSDIAHDIAHWLLCSKKRRNQRDFGLGIGPDGGKPTKQTVSDKHARAEEERASLLGVAIEESVGLDGWNTLNDHEWVWTYTDGETFWRSVAELKKRGFLDDDGRFVEPTIRPLDRSFFVSARAVIGKVQVLR